MLADLFYHESATDLGTDNVENNNDPKVPSNNLRKPIGPRLPSGFVGLENQGATCYLNSLIQVMYMTPELRDGIFSIDPNELGLNLVESDQKEEKDKSQKGIIEPDENMTETLMAMGIDEFCAKYCLIQTKNKGLDDALEYMDRISDTLDLKAEVSKLTNSQKKKKKPKYIPLELQRLFSELQLLNRETVSTQDLTSKGFQWQSAEGHIQHDAHELNRLLIDALERSLKRTLNGERLCQNLYEGKVVNQILCTGCNRISSREESFYDLNLQVTNCDSLAVALHQYCEKEVLENDSAYQCDICKKKMKAFRCTKLQKLPKILTFSCNRFKIDKSTNWQRVKITSKSEYPLLLNMNHFLNNYDLSVRSLEGNLSTVEETLQYEAGSSMLFYQQIKTLAEEFLKTEIQRQCSPDNQFNLQFILNNLQFNQEVFGRFQDFFFLNAGLFREKFEENYLLHAVIIHRGSAYSGHYFAFVRDNLQEGSSIYDSQDFNLRSTLRQILDEAYAYHELANQTNQKNLDGFSASKGNGSNNVSNERNYILTNDYLFVKNENTFYISTNHLLGKVITIFRNEENLFKSKSKKKNFDKDKPFFLQANTIMREIAVLLKSSSSNPSGASYAKLYKPVYGNIEDFIKKFSLFFSENAPGQFSLNPLNYYLLKETDFELRVTKVKSDNESSGKQQMARENFAVGDSSKSFKDIVAHDASESSSETDWQIAGKKVNSKKAIKEEIYQSQQHDKPGPSKSVLDAESELLKQTYYNSEEAYNLIFKELVEILLHKTIGNFYEFNDSQVTLITYEKLEKAFEGINSSYLIVYRKLDDFRDVFISNKPHPLPNPPLEWVEKIQKQNIIDENEREKYEHSMRRVSLLVYFEEDFIYKTPFFTFPVISSSVEKSDQVVHGQLVTMDADVPLNTIFSMVQLPSKYSADGRPLESLIISKLERYPKAGYFASDGIDLTKTFLEHKLQTNDLLLLWCPKNSPGYFYGGKSKPIDLNIFHLSKALNFRSKKINGGKFTPNQNIHITNKLDTFLYLPNHFSLLDVLVFISERFNLDADKIILSGVFPNFSSKTITTAVSNNNSSSNTNGNVENNTKLITIFKDVKFQLNNKVYYQFFINCPVIINEETSTLQDLWFLREFYVESTQSIFANDVKSLADEYFIQKSQLISVSIEIGDSVKEMLKERNLLDMISSSTLFSETFEGNTIVSLRLAKSSSVTHLKEELLYSFGLMETLPAEVIAELVDFTQARLVHSSDEETVLENEEVTISSLGLKAKSRFILERKNSWNMINSEEKSVENKSVEDTDISLTVKLVHRNSPDVNYLIYEKGIEMQEIEIKVSKEMTVREFRDLVGQKLLRFPENWTMIEENCLNNTNFFNVPDPFHQLKEYFRSSNLEKPPSPNDLPVGEMTLSENNSTSEPFDVIENYKGRRLRTTNWLKEFSDLLLETNKKNEQICMKDTNLKNQDTILFEEGILPRKGIINLQIFMWKNQLELIAKEEPAAAKASTDEKEHDENSWLESQFEEIHAIKENQLLLIGEINFPFQIELIELYESIYHLLLMKHDKILNSVSSYSEPKDIYHLLLREFRMDYLPGKAFWLNAPPTSSLGQQKKVTEPAKSSSTGPQTLGKLQSNAPVDPNNNILKKLGLKTESKSLIVECLPQPQSSIKSIHYSYQIWVQRLLNPLQCGNGKAVMSPKWPPVSIVVNGGIKPTIGHLIRPITEQFPDLTLETIVIYKYQSTSNEWQLLRSPQNAGAAALNSKATTKANATLMDSIKESDLFCVFSSLEVLNGSSSTGVLLSELLSTIKISLPEDLYFQKMKAEMKAQNIKVSKNLSKNKMKSVQWLNSHLQNKGKDGGKDGHSKYKRKEYSLTIRGDFDSDSDAEESNT